MFSTRTGWNLAPNALHRLLEEKRSTGVPVLDLTESNPTRCGFPHDPAILRALSVESSLQYEPDPRGLAGARESVAGYYAGRGIAVDPQNTFLTASTSEAYSHLFRLLCNPGDNVLVPKPSYPLFDYLCSLNDVEVRHYRLRYTDEWQVDIESMNEAVDGLTRAVLVVHPNNPTGSFVKSAERDEIIRIAQRHRLALIADEVFSEFTFDTSRHAYGSFATGENVLTFTLNGISKLLGLPQLKLAWIIASGDATLVDEATRRLEIICDTYLSAGTPVQQALPVLFREGKRVTEEMQRRVAANCSTLRAVTSGSPLSSLNADGGWNAIIRLPRILSDEAWALRVLKECNVLVHPGHFFEIENDACIVVSLLPEQSSFSNGISKTLQCVRATLGANESQRTS